MNQNNNVIEANSKRLLPREAFYSPNNNLPGLDLPARECFTDCRKLGASAKEPNPALDRVVPLPTLLYRLLKTVPGSYSAPSLPGTNSPSSGICRSSLYLLM